MCTSSNQSMHAHARQRVLLPMTCGLRQGWVMDVAFRRGDPDRLLRGFDSWGNTCDKLNNPIENASFSGQDLRGFE